MITWARTTLNWASWINSHSSEGTGHVLVLFGAFFLLPMISNVMLRRKKRTCRGICQAQTGRSVRSGVWSEEVRGIGGIGWGLAGGGEPRMAPSLSCDALISSTIPFDTGTNCPELFFFNGYVLPITAMFNTYLFTEADLPRLLLVNIFCRSKNKVASKHV